MSSFLFFQDVLKGCAETKLDIKSQLNAWNEINTLPLQDEHSKMDFNSLSVIILVLRLEFFYELKPYKQSKEL